MDEDSVVKEYLTTAADGKSYKTKHYNLDMIILVGYRVKSGVATHLRCDKNIIEDILSAEIRRWAQIELKIKN